MFELTWGRDPHIPAGEERAVIEAHVSAWHEEEVDAFWANVGDWGVHMPGAGASIEECRQMVIERGVEALEYLGWSREVTHATIGAEDYFMAAWTSGGGEIEDFAHIRVLDELRLPRFMHYHVGCLAVWFDPDGSPQLVVIKNLDRAPDMVGFHPVDAPDSYTEAPRHELVRVDHGEGQWPRN